MKSTKIARQVLYLVMAVFAFGATRGQAQNNHSHDATQRDGPTSQASALINIVRDATERFKDASVAIHEGYGLMFGCVSGPDFGAMGLHFVNGTLFKSGVIDARFPQIVIYEPQPDGSLKLIGADYLVLASQWNSLHSGPPQLNGQLFQFFDEPNRFGLPAFYTLHVWAWKENPNGAFVNWHPHVSCEPFNQSQ